MKRVLYYEDCFTKERKKYTLSPSQEITQLKCPVDRTNLIYTEILQMSIINLCPNCNTTYIFNKKRFRKRKIRN